MPEITVQEIVNAHRVAYRDAMVEAWAKRTGRMDSSGFINYMPEDVPAYITVPTNEERGLAEVTLFKMRPLQRDQRYTAYLWSEPGEVLPRVTTATGNTLAQVTYYTSKPYMRGVVSRVRGTFRATGIDGREYVGTHMGVGIYCHMRLAK